MRHVHVISKDRDVVINMDTTYWGARFRPDDYKGHVPKQDSVVQIRAE